MRKTRTCLADFAWIVLVNLPGLFLLAHFPQGPDGAEMLSTALAGGVLHPSGMPFQAWINRGAVLLAGPEHAGWALSLVSWSGHVLACFFLCRILRALGVYGLCLIVSVLAYSLHPVVVVMALQPEKYAWSAATVFFSLWAFMSVLERRRARDFYWCGLAFALAVAQHSANVVYFPLLLAAGVALYGVWPLKVWYKHIIFCSGLIAGVTAAFYISLLALRASRPWPDWGSLQSLADVWHHFTRHDFANGLFNPGSQPAHGTVSPLWIFLHDLVQWNVLALALPVGVVSLWRRDKFCFYPWMAALAAGVGVLWWANISSDTATLAYGYGERYQMLALPVVTLISGMGLAQLWTWGAPWRGNLGR